MVAGDDHVALVATLCAHAPSQVAARVLPAPDLVSEDVPVRVVARQRRVVVLDHHIVPRARHTEVQPPVGVVVGHADARVLDRFEAEARANRAVCVQLPAADVAVPAGRQFADQHDFLALHVDGDTSEVALVVAGLPDRLRRLRSEAKARRYRVAVRHKAALLVLPARNGPQALPS
jgi:hypothetical protein